MQKASSKPAPLSPRLSIYRWRLTMLSSIMHRASGMMLLLTVPLALWLLLTMSHGMAGFIYGMAWLHHPIGVFLLWATCTTLLYHTCNGIRFLSMDAGWGESRHMMKASAKLVWLVTLLCSALLAVVL